jgi:hypothetical protein
MQCAPDSNETYAVQHRVILDLVYTINQLTAQLHEQNRSFEGIQLYMSQLHQSLVDLRHQVYFLEYAQYSTTTTTTRQQQVNAEYAENGGILPLFRDPTDLVSQQQQQFQQAQPQAAEQPATTSAVAQQHHQYYQLVSAVDEAHVSSIPDPPPPTPAPGMVHFSYAPCILNEHEVEQGKATVNYQ